jgi:hypothetical protein
MMLKGIKRAIEQLYPRRTSRRNLKKQLIQKESEIGRTLFGKIPEGHQRDFYVYDERTVIWNEAWVDANNKKHFVRTRYELYPKKIVKAQDGRAPEFLSRDEAVRLVEALRVYKEQVTKKIYQNYC